MFVLLDKKKALKLQITGPSCWEHTYACPHTGPAMQHAFLCYDATILKCNPFFLNVWKMLLCKEAPKPWITGPRGMIWGMLNFFTRREAALNYKSAGP